MNPAVDEWLSQAPQLQRAQLQELRSIILMLVPEATETLKWGQPCYTRRALFCYLQRANAHVTLGFQKGAQMADPGKRLQGEGKQMRHLRFTPREEIDRTLCVALVKEAVRLDNIPRQSSKSHS